MFSRLGPPSSLRCRLREELADEETDACERGEDPLEDEEPLAFPEWLLREGLPVARCLGLKAGLAKRPDGRSPTRGERVDSTLKCESMEGD